MAKEGITFTKADKSPGSRVLGCAVMRQRLDAARKGVDQPGYYVFNTCYHTIRTVPNLERDDKDEEDIDTAGEDHLWDVIRYRVLKATHSAKLAKVVGF
jgi:hypothetical protein